MRLTVVAALIVGLATEAHGQAPIVRGDSVRISVAGADTKVVGRVASIDADSIRLDDGTRFALAAVQRVQVGRRGRANPMRQVAFAIAGGAIGLTTSKLACPGNENAQEGLTLCAGMDSRLFAAGAVAGALLGGRKKETRWDLALTPGDTTGATRLAAEAAPATPRDPPITQAAFVQIGTGDRLRIWRDRSTLEGRFARVDADALHLDTSTPIPLANIDVVERRVDRTGQTAVLGALVFGAVAAFVVSLDCAIGGSCNNYGPPVAIGAATGATVGAFVGTQRGFWRVEFSRR